MKRYDMRNDYGYCGCGMDEAIDGDYVSYEDYETLATRLATLDAERAGVKAYGREAYDTYHECIVTLHSELLQPNDGHPLRYFVRYPSGIMSTQDADKLRLFALTPTTPEASDGE